MMIALPLDGDILIADLFLGNLNVFDGLLGHILRDVLPQILDSVVVSHGDFFGDLLDLPLFPVFDLLGGPGDSLDLGLVKIFDHLLLEGHIFDPTLALDDFLAMVDLGADNSGGGLSTRNGSGLVGLIASHDSSSSVVLVVSVVVVSVVLLASHIGGGGGRVGDVGGLIGRLGSCHGFIGGGLSWGNIGGGGGGGCVGVGGVGGGAVVAVVTDEFSGVAVDESAA